MKIVIVGDGKVGREITAQLSREEHNVTVIDSDSEVLENSVQTQDIMVIRGNGAALGCLRDAGVADADLLIAATSADETNLLSCIMGKYLGVPHVIARVRNPEYTEQMSVMEGVLNLSMTINPELSAAIEAFNFLQFPSFLRRDSFARRRVDIVELKIDGTSLLHNVSLIKLHGIIGARVLVCVVERGGQYMIPGGDFVIRDGDHIYVTAPSRDLVTLLRNLELDYHKVRDVVIIGGSRIAFYLAERLLASGTHVKIIEKDYDRCVELAEKLPRADIVNGEGGSKQLLLEERVPHADAVVTLTDIDEENIFISLLAKHIGVPRIITKVSNTEFLDMISGIGIESVISPKILCATDIVRYVRAMTGAAGGGEVIAMQRIAGENVSALEFKAGERTRHLGESLSKIPIRKGCLIACIIHKNRAVIPGGDSVIHAGDTVIVVTLDDSDIMDLNGIFSH